MKKILHIFYIFLILSTLIIPIFPVIAAPKTSQDEEIVVKAGYAATEPSNWDPATYQSSAVRAFYLVNCLEKLVDVPDDWKGSWDDLIPELATDWMVEWWTPDADHSGGVKAINFTLRPGVTFHDGSAWNSTVATWNINRTLWLNGGFGPGKPTQNLNLLWFKASDFAPYFTPEWDLSWALDPDGPGGLPAPLAVYGGEICDEGSMRGYVSWINRTITYPADPLKLRIEFNMWNPKPFASFGYTWIGFIHRMISMETYATNYTFEEIPGFSNTDVNHLVGTGPYKFVAHSDIALGGGSVIKNDDWWNATAMQALGFHQVDEYKIIYYPLGAEGEEARRLALMSGEIDFAADLPAMPLDYDQVVGSVNHEYIDTGYFDGVSPAIWLNCVNESAYWTIPAVLYKKLPALGNHSIREVFGNPAGIPRPIRQALSYSFDYDTYINTELGGRAVRAGGTLGVSNEYYNSSIPQPDTDLTVARTLMLNAYPTECSAKGLNITSPSADWIHIGETDPIWTGNFHYDDRFEEMIGYMLDAAHQIGCDFETVHHPNGIWPDMQAGQFPFLEASAFCLNIPLQEVNVIGYLMSYYQTADISALLQARTRNFPFITNGTIDGYLFDAYLNNGTRKQETLNDLAFDIQNVLCPMIFTAQQMVGIGHTKEWEIYGGYWGSGTWITHTDWKWKYPSEEGIPGYQIPLICFFSTLAMLGVISVVIKHRRKII
ncbi:MAG: ABC transporter substrate-binding protein [Candidatus Thorarchaeota archaeon]